MRQTKEQIRNAFRAVGIQRIEFGNFDVTPIMGFKRDPDGPGVTDNIDLFTQNGHVEISVDDNGYLSVIDHGV